MHFVTFIFISASFEGRKLCFKFTAEFTLSLWHVQSKKCENVYLLLYIQKTQTQVYQKLQEHKIVLQFTKENFQSVGTSIAIFWQSLKEKFPELLSREPGPTKFMRPILY
jgi:hypothetical protein